MKQEKKKNVPKDEITSKINYTIEYLLLNGEKHEWKYRVIYLIIKDGKRLFYSIERGTILLCASRNELSPLMVHTVRGVSGYNENTRGVLEVAKDLGVFDEY